MIQTAQDVVRLCAVFPKKSGEIPFVFPKKVSAVREFSLLYAVGV